MVPSQAGAGETTGPVGVSSTPQLSRTVGGVGTTISETQAAVAVVGAIGSIGSYSIVGV